MLPYRRVALCRPAPVRIMHGLFLELAELTVFQQIRREGGNKQRINWLTIYTLNLLLFLLSVEFISASSRSVNQSPRLGAKVPSIGDVHGSCLISSHLLVSGSLNVINSESVAMLVSNGDLKGILNKYLATTQPQPRLDNRKADRPARVNR